MPATEETRSSSSSQRSRITTSIHVGRIAIAQGMRVVAVRAGWSRDSSAELSTRAAHDLDERRELLAATGAEPLVSARLLEAFRDRAALGPNLGVLRHERQEVVAVDLDVARLA